MSARCCSDRNWHGQIFYDLWFLQFLIKIWKIIAGKKTRAWQSGWVGADVEKKFEIEKSKIFDQKYKLINI